MIHRIARATLVAPGVPLVLTAGLYLYSPPKSLDVLNEFFPGDAGAERIEAAVSFLPGPDGKLDPTIERASIRMA